MSYITTFDGIFEILTILFAIWMVFNMVGGFVMKSFEELFSRIESSVNLFWFMCMMCGFYFSIEGTTTFLAMCVLIALALNVILVAMTSWTKE